MATSMQPQSFNGSLEDKLFEAGFKVIKQFLWYLNFKLITY